MESIVQLKTMRDEALQRLQTNADYKLKTALDNLIADLEALGQTERPKFMIIDEEDDTELDVRQNETLENVDEAFEKMAAELEGESEPAIPSEEEPQSIVSFS